MKPKLLVVELWGIGDLCIATPFIKAAAKSFDVTLLAKAHANDLRPLLWPETTVIPFSAPWTKFTGKYALHHWPWGDMKSMLDGIRGRRFDVALSARWDPRDHILLYLTEAKRCLGFPRLGSGMFLNWQLERPDEASHRYENWRIAAEALRIELPPVPNRLVRVSQNSRKIMIHSGAAQSVRVWPLNRYRDLARMLRKQGFEVLIVCNSVQHERWKELDEKGAIPVPSIGELGNLLKTSVLFIGNDSGPGHLAAALGIPTFTIFGPQRPEWFLPIHPRSKWIPGKDCQYKPCFDNCRFPEPKCILELSFEEVFERVKDFVAENIVNPHS